MVSERLMELSGVARLYRTSEVETTALSGVDFSVGRGEFVAIVGESGSGKSTLLGVLGLLDRPSSGSYRFKGREVVGAPEAVLAQMRANDLGFVFQSFNLIDDLTVTQNVELALAYRKTPVKDRREKVAATLDRLGIHHRRDHYPHQLSGGQQQRVAIARAVISEPAVILADEPTGNLDTENGRQVMDILADLNRNGSTIVMVTHSSDQARMAGRVVRMSDGRIVGAEAV
jgi:putative ABC transport system ATP-binding protein